MLKEKAFIVGACCSLFLLGWWHYLIFLHYGKDFIAGYLTKHLFIRTTQTVEGHVGGVFSYFKVLPNKGRPCGAFAFVALPVVVWRIFCRKEKEHILPVIWAVMVFWVASAVKTKLHWYIIAIYPAASIMIGWLMGTIFRRMTIIVVAVLAFSAVVYLSVEKKIFDLDYSHDSKQIAQDIRAILPKEEKIFSYNIIDPAFHFYCSDLEVNIADKELVRLLEEKNKYLLFERKVFTAFDKSKFFIIAENHSFVAAKTK